jgi:plastocyanin
VSRRIAVLVVAVLSAAALAFAAAPGLAARRATVRIVDTKYRPGSLTVRRGTRLTFTWGKGDVQPHNADLRSAPRGVRHVRLGGRHGAPVVHHRPVGYTLGRKGTYRFTCDVHTIMHLKVRVR